MLAVIRNQSSLYAHETPKDLVSEAGVRVARDIGFHEPREISAEDTVEKLGNDLVVKPVDQGSSVALHICRGAKELGTVLGDLSHGEWMIEQRILGRRSDHRDSGWLTLEIVVEVIPEGESMTTSENTPQVPPNTATQRLLIWRWRKKLKNLQETCLFCLWMQGFCPSWIS